MLRVGIKKEHINLEIYISNHSFIFHWRPSALIQCLKVNKWFVWLNLGRVVIQFQWQLAQVICNASDHKRFLPIILVQVNFAFFGPTMFFSVAVQQLSPVMSQSQQCSNNTSQAQGASVSLPLFASGTFQLNNFDEDNFSPQLKFCKNVDEICI